MSSPQGSLLWFRTDLRLHDHLGLEAAERQTGPLLCVYFSENDNRLLAPLGFSRLGPFRARFIEQALEDLKSNLQKKGQQLFVFSENPAQAIPELMLRFGLKTCRMEESKAPFEKRDEAQVRAKLGKLGLEFETYSSHPLLAAQQLPFELNRLPDVFTAFRHKVEAQFPTIKAHPPATNLPAPPLGADALEPQEVYRTNAQSSTHFEDFQGGETAGLLHLSGYFSENWASEYKETRNGLQGFRYSTRFSPWLANGNLSPRKIWAELKRYEARVGANESTYWIGFELLWRDYFYFAMQKYGDSFFRLGGIRQQPPECQADLDRFELWRLGKTGQPFIDACMKELYQTGFLSNRGRQNASSFLVHYLKLDWRWGAAWFENRLIDYDPCSNYGNWAYVAGVGNDPRPNRVFNPERQAEMYDPDKAYQQAWSQICISE
jgi:deoxyribodipyrimidine photo-lyase